jgi:uncharacterized protein YecT (DUF1311 family)
VRNSFVACLVLSGLACAQAEERTSKSYAACLDKAGGATFAMQDCISEELERQDRRLNGAYEALMGSVPEKRRAQLRDAQRKWIAFRDANCEFYYDPQGGSAARLASNECVVTLTAERAHELETLKTK